MAILVVDDETEITSVIKKGLELEDYQVELAHDGKEGLAKAEATAYELIILDLMLPKIDGLEICKTLREKKIKTPIIMLTARSATGDRALGLDTGADDYITKPFTFEELTARIRVLLRRR